MSQVEFLKVELLFNGQEFSESSRGCVCTCVCVCDMYSVLVFLLLLLIQWDEIFQL